MKSPGKASRKPIDTGWRTSVLAAWTVAAQGSAGTGGSPSRPVVDGGTYAQTRGPRFETPAEVRWLAACADVVGMTLASECVLAAEAGLRYAAVCQVDNLAAGVGTSSTGDAAMDYVLSTGTTGTRWRPSSSPRSVSSSTPDGPR